MVFPSTLVTEFMSTVSIVFPGIIQPHFFTNILLQAARCLENSQIFRDRLLELLNVSIDVLLQYYQQCLYWRVCIF